MALNIGQRSILQEAKISLLNYGFKQCKLKETISFTVANNVRSIRVMERIELKIDLNGDFLYPKLEKDHPLSKHVLCRFKKPY
ncbi:MAG: GNAT family N-acetyltransferase [Rickettsiales endosymbiont of Dermacentor nuttalli]